ncbi:ribosome-assembly protein 3-domain-containing protein [Scheffersomyces xylosifermentans]|uniref:ribosome-assembly protein 3-domain-containing protein n=1 Tax=Scheffersomyces xylosifermentans TaxID=1304137 RepID=UPI00315DC4BE
MAPRNEKPKNRRRKKRRTEDFSSDSDSSTDSEQEQTQIEQEDKEDVPETNNINIEEIDIESDTEQNGKALAPEPLSIEQHKQLNKIKLTTTPLNNLTNVPKTIANSEQIQQTLRKDRSELYTDYLKLMAGEFSNDLDELRKKPDFTDKSLVTLAKALQSGSNMFDPETLHAILHK